MLPNFPLSVKAPSPTVVSTTAAVTQGQLSSGALAKAGAQPQHCAQSPGAASQGTPAGICPTWGNLGTSVCTGAAQPELLLQAVGRHRCLQGTILPSPLLQQAWENRNHVLSQTCPLLCPDCKRPLDQKGWIQTSTFCNAGWEETALGEPSVQRQPSCFPLEVGNLPPLNPQGSSLPLENLKSLQSVLWDSRFCVAACHLNTSMSAKERGYFRNKWHNRGTSEARNGSLLPSVDMRPIKGRLLPFLEDACLIKVVVGVFFWDTWTAGWYIYR